MKRRIAFLIIIMVSFTFAQKRNITGVVVDNSNIPIEGVNVILAETGLGAATNSAGKFSIANVSYGNYKLEISAIGFTKRIIDPFVVNAETKSMSIILQEDVISTEQVIVTAGKYEQKIEDLTVSSIVLQPKTLSRQNFVSLDQALRHVPGVSMSLEQISIRGSSGYSMGAGTRVLVALDGVPLYTGDTGEIVWEIIPLTDIERIEIIKGPASSLYGSTAIGGVINIISKKPSGQAINYVNSYFGLYGEPSHDEWKWSENLRSFYGVSYTHSNSVGKLGYTFSIKKIRDDGYRENDFRTRLIGYTKLDYELSEKSSFSLIANYLYMNRGNYLYWKDSRNVLRPKDADRDQTVESNRLFLSGIYENELSDKISLTNKTSYYRSKFTGKGIEITASTSHLIRNEILASILLTEDATIVAGNEISYAEVNSTLFKAPDFFSAAGYLQAEYKGVKNTKIVVGLRYDYMKLDSLMGASALTPKFGLNYKISDDVILRGSIGTGFRAPTPAEVFTSQPVGAGINIIENPDLEAETSLSFELGAALKPFYNLNLDVAFFQNNYDNFIEPTLTTTGDIQFVNIVKAKIQGLDVNVDYQFDSLPIKSSIGYTYLWARDTKLDKPMKYRPRHMLYAGLDYTPHPFDIGVHFRYLSKVEAIDDALVQPPIALIPDGEIMVPVYVVDVTFGYYFYLYNVPMKLYLNGKNIFNYNYVEFIGNLAPIQNVSMSFEAYF